MYKVYRSEKKEQTHSCLVSEAEKIAAILVNLFKMRYNIDEIYREGTRLK